MNPSIEIDFKILSADEPERWVAIDQLAGQVAGLVDAYLLIKNLHCCDFQGGFFINIDGIPWSDDGTVDEFWMTMSWIYALKEILSGKTSANAYPWEESHLTLTCTGDDLTMEDIHSSGNVAMPRVQVSLFTFTGQIIREGEKFAVLVNAIKREIKTRRTTGVSDAVEEKLKEIERNLPDEIESEIQALKTRFKTRWH